MGGSVARVVAAVASGGTSEVARGVGGLVGGKAGDVIGAAVNPMGKAAGAAADKTLTPPTLGAPAPTAGPVAPNMQDVAKQAQLDEQKRLSMTGPSDTTNVGGARGILTDKNATYVTGKLLGGA